MFWFWIAKNRCVRELGQYCMSGSWCETVSLLHYKEWCPLTSAVNLIPLTVFNNALPVNSWYGSSGIELYTHTLCWPVCREPLMKYLHSFYETLMWSVHQQEEREASFIISCQDKWRDGLRERNTAKKKKKDLFFFLLKKQDKTDQDI